jgi:uncharacterized protein
MRVLVLGASGFVGRHLVAALRARGDSVDERSLRDPVAAAAAAEPCDAVVNLAGETLAQRWNAAVKQRIERSRTELPRRFLQALASSSRHPVIFVSASAVGYYGTSDSATFDESSPAGDDFLARVCQEWESQASRARDLGMRVALVRSGFVLGTDGGGLAKMLPPFRMGLGGVVGSGRQWISWIHVRDAVGVYLLALDRGTGAIDATAPNPVTNAAFTRALSHALERPAIAPVPRFALRALLGEGADVLLLGQRVLPTRATREYGYVFAFAEIEEALRDLLHLDAKL